jgi:N-acyl-D-aspartate/D-glutamate deacylase
MDKAFDLVVRNGLIADGSGGEPYNADVAIAGGRIAQIAPHIAGSGREELRADDLLVTPGFVDIHTHYDGQVTWEDTLEPSSQHGVTTVVMSNCAVGFAPCKPEHRELLIKLMEGIEDIPDVVMAEGLPWEWQSFPEFLDYLATRRCDVDFAAQVPHAPVRVFVMGERAAAREPATGREMGAMAELVEEALRAGALGFTSSRTINHRTRAGALAPTVTAAETELLTIADGVRRAGRGVLQMVDDFSELDDGGEDSTTFAMWQRVAARAGRPLSFSLAEFRPNPDRWRTILRHIEAANQAGIAIRAQVSSRAIGSTFGLSVSNHPFTACPSYQAIAHLPLPERVARLRDAELRERLLHEDPVGLLRPDFRRTDEMYAFGDPPDYEPAPERRLAVRAQALGIGSLALAYDLMLGDEGRALLYLPMGNYVHYSLDTTYEMLTHPNTVLGLGDGGAHVARICDASLPTYVLAHWTRDRRGARIPLERAVKMLTADTAAAVGLHDRGRLAPGYRADLNLIDYDALRIHAPRIVADLPAGGARLKQAADGYRATIVRGEVTYRDGTSSGARPGRLVRGAQPAPA